MADHFSDTFYELHSHSDDPRWYQPSEEEKNLPDTLDPWSEQVRHAKYMSYLFCALVIVGALIHGLRLARQVYPRVGLFVNKIPGVTFLAAVCRGVGYYKFRWGKWQSPPGQYLVISAAFIIGVVVWAFALTPHYFPHNEDGSPPLAIRTGMMAIGMIPFIFAMALKFNPISLLTGIPHSHMLFYHQVAAIVLLFLSIVHTVPFVWQALREEGYERLKYIWSDSYSIYWSGTVAIFFLLWIVVSSLGIFRWLSYEFFVVQHVISFTIMMACLFVHVQDLLNAHVWLWATVGIWIFSVLSRSLMVLFSTEFFTGGRSEVEVSASVGHSPAVVQDEPAKFISMSFVTPLRWRPGQHVFVRFPGMAATQAHPFTCLSLPSYSPHLPNNLVLLARVHKGITRHIHNYIMKHGVDETKCQDEEMSRVASESSSNDVKKPISDRTLYGTEKDVSDIRSMSLITALDGPYGYTYSLDIYQHSVLFAAGSGITFCLPQVTDLVRRAALGKTRCLTKSVRLLWCIRTHDIIHWVRSELLELALLAEKVPFDVVVELYVTREHNEHVDPDLGKLMRVYFGQRPDIKTVIGTEAQHAIKCESQSLSVSLCGPSSFSSEVARAVSALNWSIALGRAGSLRDVHLISESHKM